MIRYLVLVLLTSCAYYGNPELKVPEGQNYLTTNYGKVDRSCVQRYGGHLLRVFEASKDATLSCLAELKTAEGQKKFSAMSDLFKFQRLTYFCGETDYDWNGNNAWAKASPGPEFDLPKFDIKHPYVSVNPNFILFGSEKKGLPIDEKRLKETLIHEYFHNLGYYHGYSIETAYTCFSCCQRGGKEKELGCKICSTTYSGISDERYYKDFSEYAPNIYYDQTTALKITLRSALLEKPKSKFHLQKIIDDPKQHSLVWKMTSEQLTDIKIDEKLKHLEFDELSLPLKSLVEQASEAEKKMYLDGDYRGATKLLLKLDFIPLRDYFIKAQRKSEIGIMIYNSISLDLQTLYLKSHKERLPSAPELKAQLERLIKL